MVCFYWKSGSFSLDTGVSAQNKTNQNAGSDDTRFKNIYWSCLKSFCNPKQNIADIFSSDPDFDLCLWSVLEEICACNP